MKNIMFFPLWFLQLFGTAKSFQHNPIIGNPTLNRAGLHVVRVVLSHAMTNLRWWLMSPLIPRHQRKAYREQGYLVIRDFLPGDQFAKLKAELKKYSGEVRECIQGNTLTLHGMLDREATDRHPECGAFTKDKRLSRLMMYCGAKMRQPLYFVSCIKNGYTDAGADPQKTLHRDTFHPTMKAWLFIDDVNDENGPFNYVPGSQRLSWARLKWEYRHSVTGAELPTPYEQRGSFRITKTMLATLGLKDATAFDVPGNTLVIANTNGFHYRGSAPRSSRMALYAYSRSNPFMPFPGIGLPPVAWVERFITKKYFEHEDKKASARGKRSSWHLVPSPKLQK